MLLGIENMMLRARWHEVEDGVLWSSRPEGVTAIDIAPDSAGAAAGIERGDVLIGVDGRAVHTPADVLEYYHRAREGTRLSYQLLRLGTHQALVVTLRPTPRATSMYFMLAAVGLFTLLVGAAVRIRRPRDQATLHFFWLCVAFFGAFTFSFNGPLDRLDWVFYWGDAVAQALLPPLLLHFVLVFPERPASSPRSSFAASAGVLLLYLPTLVLGAGRLIAITRGAADGPAFSRAIDLLDRAELFYLCVYTAAALVALVHASGRIRALTARRQLRWIVSGTVFGVGPFAFGYGLPWALGFDPPLALQLTAIPLGLVPLAFACAIVRYRLRDVEVIVKRGLAYVAFGAAVFLLFTAMRRLSGFVFVNDRDPRNLLVTILAAAIVVLLAQRLRAGLQNVVDRLFYRDKYDYRRALVGFARDLNTDLDVVRLSDRLVARIVETLAVNRMALMLADERSTEFRAISDFGFSREVPRLSRGSSFIARLDSGHTVALDDPIAAARFAGEDVEFWRDAGVYYFVPCLFGDAAIAVLALGRKSSDQPFNSEDLELLTAVAGQAATAIENGRLYRELHLKAEQLDGLRAFNENILESLDAGLTVFDDSERIVRWNRALESFYGVSRANAIGRTLSEVFDAPFVEALAAERREHPRGSTLFRVPLLGRAQGVRLLVNATAVPLQASGIDQSDAASTILLIDNITNQVRLVEQLQLSEKMASIGVLAAGVAHEVNTPLTGISSFTQMLLEQADPADPRTGLLEKIERQTFRAAKIVSGLLNLSRPGASGDERLPVDLNAVVGDVFSLLEHEFAGARVKVRRELSPTAVGVLGVEHKLQQVFLNLFLNARDAMPRGGWLSVATRVDGGDRVVAEIADTGSGIPPEHLARIYDPFFTTKVMGRGTGLGLSITYGIVQEHRGTIGCESTVGQGTRFTLTFPLASPVRSTSRAQG
jgi:PAS domain S-box-containing protein